MSPPDASEPLIVAAASAPLAAEPVALDYGRVASHRNWLWRVGGLAAWLALAACLVGTAAIYHDVESVLASGPSLFLLGLLALCCGLLARRPALAALGAAHVGVCLLFVGLVYARSWSPGEARLPFRVMSAFYCVPVVAATVIVAARLRPPAA